MRILTYATLREYAKKHNDCQVPLDNWHKVASKANWSNLIEVQSVFPTAEAVGNFTIFNIKGNKYRLIVDINYQRKLIYIKYVLTHAEYDKEYWKNDPYF